MEWVSTSIWVDTYRFPFIFFKFSDYFVRLRFGPMVWFLFFGAFLYGLLFCSYLLSFLLNKIQFS